MKKCMLVLTLFIAFSIVVLASSTTGFYWYRTSKGDTSQTFNVNEFGFKPIVLIAAGGNYNAFAKSTNIFTSHDGVTWIERDGTGYNIDYQTSISGNENGYVIGGHNGDLDDLPVGAIVNSETAKTWESNILSGSAFLDIVWVEDKGIFVAVGDYGAEGIRTSVDGKTWNNFTSNATLYGVASGNGEIVAVGEWGDGGLYTSSDGTNWNKGNNTTGKDFYGIDYGNGKFVAVGDNQIYYIPSSGSLTAATGNFSGSKIYSVKWNGTVFVAVGGSGSSAVAYTSPDGITWQKNNLGGPKVLKDITWSKELNAFFAVGDGVVMKSSDGSSWTNIAPKDLEGNQLSMNLETIYSEPLPQEAVPDKEIIILALADVSHALEISGHLFNYGGGIGAYTTKVHGVNISSYTHYDSDSGSWQYDFLPEDMIILPEANENSVLNVTPGFLPFDKLKVRDFEAKDSYGFVYYYDEKVPTMTFNLPDKIVFNDNDPTGKYNSLIISTEQNIIIGDKDVIISVDDLEINETINVSNTGATDTDLFIFVNDTLSFGLNADIISDDGSYEHVYIIHNGDSPVRFNGNNSLDAFFIKRDNIVELAGNVDIGYIFMKNAGLKAYNSLFNLNVKDYVYTEYGKIDFRDYSGLYNVGKGILTGVNDGLADNAIIFGRSGGSSTKKTLRGDGSFIYAPYGNAHFKTTANADYTGSIIADTIKIESNSFEVRPPAETKFPDPDIPQPEYNDGGWYLLTVTGYDISNNAYVYGDLAVYRTEQVDIKIKQPFYGDIIIDNDGLINGHTLEEIDGHNQEDNTAYQMELELPVCECSIDIPYSTKSQDPVYKKDAGINHDIIINANAVVNYDLCIPEGYNLHINGNSEIYGNIIAPNSSEIFINGTTIVDGKICAPNSILRVNGQATIEGPIYIYFLDMQNGSIGKE